MTEERHIDIKEVIAKFQDRRGGRPHICEICGGTQWAAGDIITIPVRQSGESMRDVTIGGPFLPLMGMACIICGNTKFINLVRLGFIPPYTKVDRLLDQEFPEGLGKKKEE